MYRLARLLVVAVIPLAVVSCADVAADDHGASYAGTYDDLPIEDDDMLGLEQMLRAKWRFFLYSMDLYNQGRDSGQNEQMIDNLELVFAPEFEFNAYNSDGSEFGDVQGTYTPRTWVEANDVEETFDGVPEMHTLLVPNYDHFLQVNRMGESVTLLGYHEHMFVGEELRLALGDARHLAYETIVFEKVDGVWRVTDYEENIWGVSEVVGTSPPARP